MLDKANARLTDFLTLGTARRIKRQLRNICNSYSHPWDVLAELTQNSVDAIKKWNRLNKEISRRHEISIEINQKTRTVIVSDTGVGIEPDLAPVLLGPNETDKENDPEMIGEKGVGLTFAIFSSDGFLIDTKSKKGLYHGEISYPHVWMNNEDYSEASIPKIQNEVVEKREIDPLQTGTTVCLNGVNLIPYETSDIFEMSSERLAYLLRTKTAIGYTGKRFGKGNLDIKVSLKVTKPDGSTKVTGVPFEYQFPDQFLKTSDVVDLDEYDKVAGSLSDERKRQKLRGQCLKLEGHQDINGRPYHFFAFFVPSTQLWENISINNQLFSQSGTGSDVVTQSDVGSGIFVSTKGMPTGVELVAPSAGAAGYWANFFALIEDDAIKFDIGRKFVHYKIQDNIKALAKSKFNRMAGLKQFVAEVKIPSPLLPQIASLEKNQKIAELDSGLPNLGFGKIKFLKEPTYQEAGVVAIFHELIGAGVLKGYFGLKEGYRANYDFWGLYQMNKSNLGKNIRDNKGIPEDLKMPLVVEFKFDAASVIPDVETERKHFIDIDLIVCWSIDENAFKKSGIDVQPLKEEDVFYHGSNYILDWPSTSDFGAASRKPVLSLKRFIEDQVRMT